MLDENMLPILKGHVFFQESANGVYFNGGSERSFLFGGKGLYPLVSRLVAAMDGQRSVGMIASALPPRVAPVFSKLLDELYSRRLIVDNRDALVQLPEVWQTLYADTIGYLRDNVGDFATAFARWRNTPVFAVGSGYVLKALLRALARSGTMRLSIAIERGGQPKRDELIAALRNHAAHDPEFSFELVDPAAVAATDDPQAPIVFAADHLDPTEGSALSALLARNPPGLLVGGVLNGTGVVGPHSLTDGSDFTDLVDRLRLPPMPLPHSITSRSVIGNLLALQLLRVENGLARGDRMRLRNFAFTVSPGPEVLLCPIFSVARPGRPAKAGTALANTAPALSDRDLQPLELLHERLVALFDPRSGLFSRELGRDLPQIPLSLDSVEIFWPCSYARSSEATVGWGLDSNEAGMRALMRAVARYAEGVEAHLGIHEPTGLTAAPSETNWRQAALVDAICADPYLRAAAKTTALPVARLADAIAVARARDEAARDALCDIDTLLRLASGEGLHALTLTGFGPFGPWLCHAGDGACVFSGQGASQHDAVLNALGSLLAARQTQGATEPSVLPEVSASDAPLDLTATDDVVALEQWLFAQGITATARMFRSDPVFATHGLSVGRIALVRG